MNNIATGHESVTAESPTSEFLANEQHEDVTTLEADGEDRVSEAASSTDPIEVLSTADCDERVVEPGMSTDSQAEAEVANDTPKEAPAELSAEDSAPSKAPDNLRKMPVISDAKKAANRANAQRSTGPKTPEGKGYSRANATRHGLRAKTLLLDGSLDPSAEPILAALHAE
jgi:hypothetical protein